MSITLPPVCKNVRILGEPHMRIDGAPKVTGGAVYASDVQLPGLCHAALVLSTIAKGHILGFRLEAASSSASVLGVFTYLDFADAIAPVDHFMAGGHANSSHRPFGSDVIAYAGQIVALVVAETRETAEMAAALLGIDYKEEPFAATLNDDGAETVRLADLKPDHEDPAVGDAAAAFETADARIDARYETPIQHHNPIELFTATCAWDGPRLTVYEPTRYGAAVQYGLAAQLSVDPDDVRVVTGPIGGHFGSKLALSQHTALVALAAKHLRRPVSLVPTRQQCFTIATHRPETRHAIRLGADRGGRFVALSHQAWMATSRFDAFAMEGTDVTASLYACPNVSTEESAVRVDRNTPGPMRAPPEVPYLFALESAVDEMAWALELDPIELRRRNDATVDPISGKPFSSRPLMHCFDAGAEAFGWDRRIAEVGAMRDGPWRIGLGCASAARPVKTSAATMRIRLSVAGNVVVSAAQHEIGNGVATLLAMGVADWLGVPVERVTVDLGDTALPASGLSGGSSTTTSLMQTLALGCTTLRARVAVAVVGIDGPLEGSPEGDLRFESCTVSSPDGRRIGLCAAVSLADPDGIETLAEFVPPAGEPGDLQSIREGRFALRPGAGGKALSWAFGAQFAEVRVHEDTGEIHVPRLLGAFAAGRVLNPLTARSQLTGGMVWGLGSALLERTIIDRGRYVNDDLAEYLMATASDIADVTAIVIPDEDTDVNGLGVKGLGELGVIGVNAAIANAVFHATGRRIRRLPIRIDDML